MKIIIDNLDMDSIKETCPKAITLLEEFVMQGIKKELENTEMEPQVIVELLNNITINGIQFHHRILFDFFDEQRMYIVIDCANYETGDEWYPVINNIDQEVQVNRVDAELCAIREAFSVLEEQLNKG